MAWPDAETREEENRHNERASETVRQEAPLPSSIFPECKEYGLYVKNRFSDVTCKQICDATFGEATARMLKVRCRSPVNSGPIIVDLRVQVQVQRTLDLYQASLWSIFVNALFRVFWCRFIAIDPRLKDFKSPKSPKSTGKSCRIESLLLKVTPNLPSFCTTFATTIKLLCYYYSNYTASRTVRYLSIRYYYILSFPIAILNLYNFRAGRATQDLVPLASVRIIHPAF